MTRLLVAGGTGTAGRAVVSEALARGIETRVLSRHIPGPGDRAYRAGAVYFQADVGTGAGLAGALSGVDVVIDTLDGRFGRARRELAAGSRRLIQAAAGAGVRRAVLLSIVNVDQGALAYYRAKAGQEQAYRSAPLETVIVRSTQFHQLVAGLIGAAAKARLFLAFNDVSFQPIAVTDLARSLVDAAVAASVPDGGMVTIGGPETATMESLARTYKLATGGRGAVVKVRAPGAFGDFLRRNANLVPENPVGSVSFQQWLRSDRQS